MDTNYITSLENFVEDGISYLPEYIRKDALTAFMQIFLERLKNLETVAINLAEYRLLANAEGDLLDEIGSQLGVYRNGQSDSDFKSTILIHQIAATCGGTRPDISSLMEKLFLDGKWRLYKGTNYRVDVYVATVCFEVANMVDSIVDIFPLMTQLRIVEVDISRPTFGFYGDKYSGGFGSSNLPTSRKSGRLAKVVYTTDDEVHG